MERVEVKNGKLYIRMEEDLDHCFAEQIRGAIDYAIEKHQIYHLVFDVCGMQFMDSAGIGFIMGRYKKVYLHKGSIDIVGIEPPIDRILRISGLYKIVNQENKADKENR